MKSERKRDGNLQKNRELQIHIGIIRCPFEVLVVAVCDGVTGRCCVEIEFGVTF